jgi:hypothetical protein
MPGFVQGWGFTFTALAVITLVFLVAEYHLSRELGWVRALADYLSFELVTDKTDRKLGGSLLLESIRDEAQAIKNADAVWAHRHIRTWQMRAQRLEAALVFWTELLRQLGLLGTVLGIGLSLAIEGDVRQLLGPLATAVWKTVAGLTYSIILSAQFGMRVRAWVDACEKNIEAWAERVRTAAKEAA